MEQITHVRNKKKTLEANQTISFPIAGSNDLHPVFIKRKIKGKTGAQMLVAKKLLGYLCMKANSIPQIKMQSEKN